MSTTFTPLAADVGTVAEAKPLTARALAATGLVAGIAASAATVAVALAAKAVDIPMQVAARANDAAEDIPMSDVGFRLPRPGVDRVRHPARRHARPLRQAPGPHLRGCQRPAHRHFLRRPAHRPPRHHRHPCGPSS